MLQSFINNLFNEERLKINHFTKIFIHLRMVCDPVLRFFMYMKYICTGPSSREKWLCTSLANADIKEIPHLILYHKGHLQKFMARDLIFKTLLISTLVSCSLLFSDIIKFTL